MKKISFSLLLASITSVTLFGLWERSIEIKMVRQSKTLLMRQEKQLQQLVVEAQKMGAIGNALLFIFFDNLTHQNRRELHFQRLIEQATQDARVQLMLLDKIINGEKPVKRKMLALWIDRKREEEFKKNIALMQSVQQVLNPWRYAAMELTGDRFDTIM